MAHAAIVKILERTIPLILSRASRHPLPYTIAFGHPSVNALGRKDRGKFVRSRSRGKKQIVSCRLLCYNGGNNRGKERLGSMVYFSVTFLCTAGLFLALLEGPLPPMDHCGRHGGGVRPGPGAGLSHPAAHHRPCLGGPGGLRGGGAAVFRHVSVPLHRQHPAKAVRGAALPVRFRLSQLFCAPVSGSAALPGSRGPGGGAVHRGGAAVHLAAGPVPVPPPAPLQRPWCLRVFGGHVPAAVLCVPAVPGAV